MPYKRMSTTSENARTFSVTQVQLRDDLIETSLVRGWTLEFETIFAKQTNVDFRREVVFPVLLMKSTRVPLMAGGQ